MKNILRALSVFLFVLIIVSIRSTVTNAFDSGEGTISNPYVIKSPGELDDISDELDAYYILGNDIDMTDYHLTPIGNYSNPFTGRLDGDGYSILNLSARTTLIEFGGGDYPDAYTMAMFGVIGGSAEIYDLGLTLNYVFDDQDIGDIIGGDILVGGLVGLVDSSDVSIYDVWISGSIDVTVASPMNFVSIGGLIGEAYNQYIYGMSYSGEIKVDLGEYLGSSLEGLSTGGIIGYAENTSLSESTVFDSTLEVISNSEYDSVGGLVGYAYNDYLDDYDIISDSVVDNLTIKASGNNSVGGVVGYVYDDSGYTNYIHNNWVKNSTFIGG
ncbi:MAG: hypothetical protein WCI62_01915, partial [Erysipelotrichaceae bacterium]